MTYLAINGKPFCTCSFNDFGLTSTQHMDMVEDQFARNIFVACMHSDPDNATAIAFLKEYGIEAQEVEGECPVFNRR